jgi:serine/threonine-protein kinase HipA
MENQLYLWIYSPGALKPEPCGTLDLIGGRRILFSYSPEWLADKNAFALSPDLPLRAGQFEPASHLDLHPIFEDAGPDRWGRQIIDKVFQPARRAPIDYLALAGEDRIGALGFSSSPKEYVVAKDQAFHAADLGDLLRAAHAVEHQMPIDDSLRRLLRPGASAGGARPKAIIEDEGRHWIAKFPADGDMADVCAIEHASLRLASQCGIAVPESRLVPVRSKNVLLVERFDRASNGSRHHFASARTLLIAQGVDVNEMGYSDIADAARLFSVSPKEDCVQLFRRMALNVLMENTDDHEKNHAFLHDGKSGWKLAPAYDVQPQLQGIGYQQLRVGKMAHEPSIANVLSDCGRFMLTDGEAYEELERLTGVLSCWPEHFSAAGVSSQDIDLCQRYVLVGREMARTYGEVPASVVEPNRDHGRYSGEVVAVRPHAVYQSIGAGETVAHAREGFGAVPPAIGTQLRVSYENDKIVRIDRKEKTTQRGTGLAR